MILFIFYCFTRGSLEGPCFLYLKGYGVRLHFSMCDSPDSRKVKTWSKNAKAHDDLR